jgi:hypothetical protein
MELMNIGELLERWLDDSITTEELRELTAKLAQPSYREALLDDWLIESSLPDVLGASSAELSDPETTQTRVGMVSRRPRRRDFWLRPLPLAAAAACVLLLFSGVWLTRLKSSRSRPDVVITIASAQQAVARLSVEPPSTLSAWMSPTASMLEPPQLPR